MANPRFTQHQIRSKKSIHSSFNAPQLDKTNESVTNTCHSQPNLCKADINNDLATNKAHSTPNLCETENHGEELFSVPIRYGAIETHTKTLVTHPYEPKKGTPPKPTWTRVLRPPFTPCMITCKDQKTVGAKRQYDCNEHGDRIQNRVASKRNKTVEDSLQTTAPTAEADA